ncbi:MAG: endonuclease/exonuclease/phosphatase family protein [bacterium]|nr:endonuclease/exonuclease/phosphatase family protein [bacterium]
MPINIHLKRGLICLVMLSLLISINCKPGSDDNSNGGENPSVTPVTIAALAVLIDGLFNEWQGLTPVYTDQTGDAGTSGVDLGGMYLANDDRFLYIMIDVGIQVYLQEYSRITIYLDTDNNPQTGFTYRDIGAELVYDFGLKRGTFHRNGNTFRLNHPHIRLRMGPTVSSSQFEIAIGRDEIPDGSNPLFPGETFRILIADHSATDGDELPNSGTQLAFKFNTASTPAPDPISLEKDSPQAIRLVTYNVLFDRLFQPEAEPYFQRTLQALDPDIICFQEVFNHTPREVKTKVETWLPLSQGQWFAAGSGDQVTVSRFPFVDNWPASTQPLPPDIFPALIRLDPLNFNRRLLVFNAHLDCCTQDDERQRQVDSFIAFLRDAQTPGGTVDLPTGIPFILTGDLNLVGDSRQLETLLNGTIVNQNTYGPPHTPDWDGTSLADLISRQTQKRMAYTWRNDNSEYAPGRLDFIIFTDSVLSVDKHFILYTPEMTSDQLSLYGLLSTDTANASDHLPHVADFIF